jgi:hypothetical protein
VEEHDITPQEEVSEMKVKEQEVKPVVATNKVCNHSVVFFTIWMNCYSYQCLQAIKELLKSMHKRSSDDTEAQGETSADVEKVKQQGGSKKSNAGSERKRSSGKPRRQNAPKLVPEMV